MIYHIHPITREYLGSSPSEYDPIENLPLVPKYATLITPSSVGPNEVPIWVNGAWETIDDYRGQDYYDPLTGQKIEIELGDNPSGLASSPRPNEFYTWSGSQWVEDLAAKTQAVAETQILQYDMLLAKSFIKVLKVLIQKGIIQVSDLPQDLVDAYQARMALRND